MPDDVTPPETWLPVPGYEGFYEASDLGRVRSLRHLTHIGPRGGRVLKQNFDGSGRYLFVTLCRKGIRKIHQVHVLVALTFIGPRPPGLEVCHGPGGKTDNRASELRYDTRAGNMADCIRDGTDKRGERCPAAKLTWDDVDDIRRRWAAGGETQAAMAQEYGVGFGTISKIVLRTRWRYPPIGHIS